MKTNDEFLNFLIANFSELIKNEKYKKNKQ